MRGGSVGWSSTNSLKSNLVKLYEKKMQRHVESYMREQKIGYYVDLGGKRTKNNQR